MMSGRCYHYPMALFSLKARLKYGGPSEIIIIITMIDLNGELASWR